MIPTVQRRLVGLMFVLSMGSLVPLSGVITAQSPGGARPGFLPYLPSGQTRLPTGTNQSMQGINGNGTGFNAMGAGSNSGITGIIGMNGAIGAGGAIGASGTNGLG